MSSRKLSKIRSQPARASTPPDYPQPRERDVKSFISGKSKSKRKALTPEAGPPNELARLLGNRTRALLLFEQPDFDAELFLEDYLADAGDKAIENARQDLGALLAACSNQVEGVVKQHHQRFLEAVKGVGELEDQVALLRNYVNGLTALVASLKQSKPMAKQIQAASSSGPGSASPRSLLHGLPTGSSLGSSGSSSKVAAIEAQLEVLLQDLDVAAAERDLATARAVLAVGNDALAILDRDASLLSLEVEDFPSWRHQVESALGLRKHMLTLALERQVGDANTTGAESRACTRALADMVGDSHAASAMLNCYSHKIGRRQQQLIKQYASGADPDALEFAGSLVQHTFLELGNAADDLVAAFGVSQEDVAALFSVWAAREGRACAGQLRQHALAAAAASASSALTTTMQVVSIALVFCAALEQSHLISLTAAVTMELWPSVEGAVRRHLKRTSEERRMAATEEVNSLVLAVETGGLRIKAAPEAPVQVTRMMSGEALCSELSILANLMTPLAGPKLSAALSKGVHDLFAQYTQTIGFTLKTHLQGSSAAAAQLQQLVPIIMLDLEGLIEEGIPAALAPYMKVAGPVVDGKVMDKALKAMYRDCQAGTRAARQGLREGAVAAAGSSGGGA